tara:strand:+ start:50 stop:754 length:705 start_codon:yes stop_codon:yes gene_type:complete
MSKLKGESVESYNKRVKESKEKTEKIKKKLAELRKKAKRKANFASMGLEDISPTTIKSQSKKAMAKFEAERKKIEEIKKNIKKATLKTSVKGETSVKRAKAGDNYKQYTSISAAKKAGSPFYSKNGKKMAAVTAEDLKKSGLSLRDYMNKMLGKTRKMSTGGMGLKAVPSGSKGKGLSKLPKAVRNKMGFMNKGSLATKKKTKGSAKGGKGVIVVSIGIGKMKKKPKKKTTKKS